MFVQQLFNGITLGVIYALIAVGYSLVFGILRIVNFSHGSVYAFGAYITLLVTISVPFGLLPAIIVSLLVSGCLGYIIDFTALKPLRKKESPPIATLITTIGISYIIQNMLMIVFGSESKFFPKIFDFGIVYLFGAKFQSTQLFIFGVSLLLLLGLTIFIHKTKIGLAMRGVEQNMVAAHLVGVPVNRIIGFTFFLGGATASIAASLVSGNYQIVYPLMGFMTGLKAFSASVLGGIGVLHGAVIGGLIIGVCESLAGTYIDGGMKDAVAFIILILVIVIKPTGLFGKKTVMKV